MTITVLYSPAQLLQVGSAFLQGTVAVVVDQLRATSTMLTALANGADSLVAVPSLELARVYHRVHPQVLLAGERGGRRPEGFDLGNSPREFTPNLIQGREIAITTTNGTVALIGCREAAEVWIASLLNLQAVIDRLRQSKHKRLLLVVAGTGDDFSLEDAMVLAEIVHALQPTHPLGSLRFFSSGGYPALLRRTKNGRRLCQLGLQEDIDFCSQMNRFNLVPECTFERLSGKWMARVTAQRRVV